MLANLSVKKAAMAIGLVAWVACVFIGAQYVVAYLISILTAFIPALATMNESVAVTIYAALAYLLAVTLAVGVPWWLKQRTTRTELGIRRPPTWSDIGLGIAGYVAYFLLSFAVSALISLFLHGEQLNQAQDLPFAHLVQNFEFMAAFLTLVLIAPFAEELLFRGFLLGKLAGFLPAWLAVGISALAFGAMHLPGSTGVQWLVGMDTFALGIVAGTLRIRTGNIWAGMLVHMVKNSIAFYFLFINPINIGML